MGKINRTLSFLKRNGLRPTAYAVMERLGKWGPDPEQRKADLYAGKALDEMTGTGVLQEKYRFSIVVPTYETAEPYLREMLDSVCAQTYSDWQLVIADASASDKVYQVVKEYNDSRIKYVRLEENKGISDNTNQAMQYADGDYIGLLDHDDTLHPEALMEIAALLEKNTYEMIYTDEDKINEDSSLRFEPNFKPDFNFDFLLSNNYICHFTVLSRKLAERLSFRPEYDGAQDYDLFLQAVYEIEKMHRDESCAENPQNEIPETYIPYEKKYMSEKIGHVPRILYHWRAHTASTADNPESKLYAYEAGRRALENFAKENGWDVSVTNTRHLGFYEVTYHPDIFAVRKDVVAVCGKMVRKGRVVQGPVMDGRELFVGMNQRYSGYMHRAVLKFEADGAAQGCIKRREDVSLSPEKRECGRMVYLPDFVVRK